MRFKVKTIQVANFQIFQHKKPQQLISIVFDKMFEELYFDTTKRKNPYFYILPKSNELLIFVFNG